MSRVTGIYLNTDVSVLWWDYQAPGGRLEVGIRYEAFSHWGMIEIERTEPVDIERHRGWVLETAMMVGASGVELLTSCGRKE